MQQNPHLQFIFPKDGAFVWIDNVAIPKHAPHLANAYRFINFILQPRIAKEIALYSGFSSPNRAAKKLLPRAMQQSKVLYPSRQVIDQATFEQDLGAANRIYEHYWFALKLSSS